MKFWSYDSSNISLPVNFKDHNSVYPILYIVWPLGFLNEGVSGCFEPDRILKASSFYFCSYKNSFGSILLAGFSSFFPSSSALILKNFGSISGSSNIIDSSIRFIALCFLISYAVLPIEWNKYRIDRPTNS